MPCVQGKTTPLPELFQYNHALFGINRLNPFIEGFLLPPPIAGVWYFPFNIFIFALTANVPPHRVMLAA